MQTQINLSRLVLLLTMCFVFVGCDTNKDEDEELTIAEQFEGTWRIVSASDMGGAQDQSDALASFGTLNLSFNVDGTYSLSVLTGQYTIVESTNTISLIVPTDPPTTIPITYEFISDTEARFTIPQSNTALLSTLLGVLLEGDVVLNAQKVS